MSESGEYADAFLHALFVSLSFLHSGEQIFLLENDASIHRRFFMTRTALPNNSTTEQRQQSQQPKSFDKLSNASIRMFYALKEMKKNAGDEEDEAEKACSN